MGNFDIILLFSMLRQTYLPLRSPPQGGPHPGADAMPTPVQTNVLIAFYSRNGATEALAKAVAEGVRAAGGEVRLRRAREVVGPEIIAHAPGWADNAARMNDAYPAPTEDDAVWADAIVFGTPTRFGAPTSELRAYIDTLGGVWFQGKLNGKAGGAFGATSSRHGGNESTLLSLYNTFAHLGLIIVPTGYADGAMFKAGTPYGATAVVPPNGAPTDDDLAAARFQGKRITDVAAALKAAQPQA
jgi:NAD(P)H dehydrogenase (quinone)